MANIVYGICGEGRGHALRSRAVIDHLKEKNHTLLILASNKAYEICKDLYDNVHEIHGFQVKYENNRVQSFSTVISNLSAMPKGLPQSIIKVNKLFREFQPDLCITDFEPYTSYLAQREGLPCIAIDNISLVTKTDVDYDLEYSDFLVAKAIASYMVPYARDYLITTFFYPPVTSDDTTLVPPIIRESIITAKEEAQHNPPKEDHILVYQTSESNDSLFSLLKAVKETFVIYGFQGRHDEENLIFRDFSEGGIVEDLVKAKGVITNGGFTLMSEALYLGKPVLSEPVGNQFEQHINGFNLQQLGIGQYTQRMNLADLLDFLSNLSLYKEKLNLLSFDDNRRLYSLVDQKIREYRTDSQ